MAQVRIDAKRLDPYKNFKFRVKLDGRIVAGVSKVSALKRTTEVVEHREGGDRSSSRRSPRAAGFEPITLERGITHDTEFEAWANSVRSSRRGTGAEASLAGAQRDIVIELIDEAGAVAGAYRLTRCWVSEFRALSDLDANANAVEIHSITLQHEGLEHDVVAVAPKGPTKR